MSTRNLLPADKTQYDGPKSHRAIIRQIHEDCRKGMSYDYIEKVIGLFFSSIGIQKHMKAGINFRIPLLGSFMITKRERLKREKEDLKKRERARLSHNRKVSKYMKKKTAMRQLVILNNNREKIGLKPLDFNTFIKIRRDNHILRSIKPK